MLLTALVFHLKYQTCRKAAQRATTWSNMTGFAPLKTDEFKVYFNGCIMHKADLSPPSLFAAQEAKRLLLPTSRGLLHPGRI